MSRQNREDAKSFLDMLLFLEIMLVTVDLVLGVRKNFQPKRVIAMKSAMRVVTVVAVMLVMGVPQVRAESPSALPEATSLADGPSDATFSGFVGDKEQAAILLGISLATLYRKLAGED